MGARVGVIQVAEGTGKRVLNVIVDVQQDDGTVVQAYAQATILVDDRGRVVDIGQADVLEELQAIRRLLERVVPS